MRYSLRVAGGGNSCPGDGPRRPGSPEPSSARPLRPSAPAPPRAVFGDLMAHLGLNPTYGRYLDRAPAPLLATLDQMSLFGLHRALRGALVGHFLCVEVTSSPGSRRPRPCGAARPDLEAEVAFGCSATVLLEDRLAHHVRENWDHGRSALRGPLPPQA
ncbi:iron-containing redox enzyme family protein [Streptomyces virginiae]|uniref:iron-containing redox enzyme family protein n=1 Tax=Streptomyces virginiae TaxID=1961 RepID=UPI0036A2F5ED